MRYKKGQICDEIRPHQNDKQSGGEHMLEVSMRPQSESYAIADLCQVFSTTWPNLPILEFSKLQNVPSSAKPMRQKTAIWLEIDSGDEIRLKGAACLWACGAAVIALVLERAVLSPPQGSGIPLEPGIWRIRTKRKEAQA